MISFGIHKTPDHVFRSSLFHLGEPVCEGRMERKSVVNCSYREGVGGGKVDIFDSILLI